MKPTSTNPPPMFMALEAEVRRRLWTEAKRLNKPVERIFCHKTRMPTAFCHVPGIIGLKVRWEYVRKHHIWDYREGMEISLNDVFNQVPSWEIAMLESWLKSQTGGNSHEQKPNSASKPVFDKSRSARGRDESSS